MVCVGLVKQVDKQPQIIGSLIDYYLMYGIANTSSSSKSIVDLICRIPDEICYASVHFSPHFK